MRGDDFHQDAMFSYLSPEARVPKDHPLRPLGKDVRPGPEAGYTACQAATDGPVEEGCIGAGTGATVGKLLGPQFATKSGVGSLARRISGDVTVGALVAVNAFGDVVDPATGRIIAVPAIRGVRNL